MSTQPPAWIHQALSPARFDPYLKSAGGDGEMALRLYWWNVEVSAAFYGPLHCLEVALRNALHDCLTSAHGQADWWEVAPLGDDGRRAVALALGKLRRRGVVARTADDVVAELTLGFWVSLLSRRADRTFWVPVLHAAFPGYSGRRARLHRDLESIRLFRNRVMHYEPIHDRPLAIRRAMIYQILEYLGPEFAAQAHLLDRVPEVLARRDQVCSGDHSPRF